MSRALTALITRALLVAMSGWYFMLGVGIAHAHMGSPARTIDYGNAILLAVLFSGAFTMLGTNK